VGLVEMARSLDVRLLGLQGLLQVCSELYGGVSSRRLKIKNGTGAMIVLRSFACFLFVYVNMVGFLDAPTWGTSILEIFQSWDLGGPLR